MMEKFRYCTCIIRRINSQFIVLIFQGLGGRSCTIPYLVLYKWCIDRNISKGVSFAKFEHGIQFNLIMAFNNFFLQFQFFYANINTFYFQFQKTTFKHPFLLTFTSIQQQLFTPVSFKVCPFAELTWDNPSSLKLWLILKQFFFQETPSADLNNQKILISQFNSHN